MTVLFGKIPCKPPPAFVSFVRLLRVSDGVTDSGVTDSAWFDLPALIHLV
jgi:hypothetical protein